MQTQAPLLLATPDSRLKPDPMAGDGTQVRPR